MARQSVPSVQLYEGLRTHAFGGVIAENGEYTIIPEIHPTRIALFPYTASSFVFTPEYFEVGEIGGGAPPHTPPPRGGSLFYG